MSISRLHSPYVKSCPCRPRWPADRAGRPAHPVERDVGERRLRAPARRRVDAEHEGLDALLRLVVGKVVLAHERRQVGIEAAERLGAGPFVLHDAQEVDHLVAQAGQVAGRLRRDLAGHAAQALLDELLERPARAVARQHGQVVQVDVGVAVRRGHLVVVDFRQPVVRRDGAGVRQDEAADGIRDRGVLLHTPVFNLHVLVHQVLVVEQRRIGVAHLLALAAVQDVGLRHVGVPGSGEHFLHAVLDVLDVDDAALDLWLEMRGHVQGQKVDGGRMVLLLQRVERLGNGCGDFGDVDALSQSVSLLNLIHACSFDCAFHCASSFRLARCIPWQTASRRRCDLGCIPASGPPATGLGRTQKRTQKDYVRPTGGIGTPYQHPDASSRRSNYILIKMTPCIAIYGGSIENRPSSHTYARMKITPI